MKELCDAHHKASSEDLLTRGDYVIIEQRGMSDQDFAKAVEALKADLSPKGFFQKAYWKIFIRKPVQETPQFISGLTALLKKKNLWPNYRALLLTCPHCGVPFASSNDHKIVFDEPLTVDKDLVCPYGKKLKIKIENGKLYELTQ